VNIALGTTVTFYIISLQKTDITIYDTEQSCPRIWSWYNMILIDTEQSCPRI
jgi:hypothetical protein